MDSREEKDLISSEDVLAVVNGDQEALIQQLERAKEVAKEQLEQSHNQSIETKQKLEEELRKKEEELALARKKQAEAMQKEQQAYAEEESKRLAQEEAKKKKQEEVLRAQEAARRKKDMIEAKKLEKENAKRAKEEAKREKKLARKQAKEKKNEPVEAPSNPVSPVAQPSPVTPPVNTPPAIPATSQKPVESTVQPVQQPVNAPTTNTQVPVNNQAKEKQHNFKYYMTFVFMIGLILMVIFLPNISDFIKSYQRAKEAENAPVITTGTLTCTMTDRDDKFDYYYEANFSFRDSKMYRLNYNTTIKGDRVLDAEELSAMKSSCDILSNQVENMDGIRVTCSLSEGVYENDQVLDYTTLDPDLVTTAYLEAGGTYPNYENEQSIDEIEKEMNASNYKCERVK